MELKNPYEALDAQGQPYVREAATVGELSYEKRFSALDAATRNISKLIGLDAVSRIAFGMPVYTAFGLNNAQAKTMAESKLLLCKGESVSLSHCSV